MASNYEDKFWRLGCNIIGHNISNSMQVGMRRYKSFFGCSPKICAIIWTMLKSRVSFDTNPSHLLWALLFLKQYNPEHIMRTLLKRDEKTLRKWIWYFVTEIALLKLIKWEKRKTNSSSPVHSAFVSLDGTDFRISKPKPYDKKWFSHKFRGPGLRYEVGLSLNQGHIVWANGPYPCGDWPDIKIARDSFVERLDENEKVFADLGYRDNKYFIIPKPADPVFNKNHKRIMSRHETVNGRIKNFHVMSDRFRHATHLHGRCFYAVLNIVQLSIENGEPLFEF